MKSGILRNMLIYGLGALFLKGISFFLIPLYTRMLLPQDYGNLELLNTFTSILEIICSIGLFNFLYMDFFHKDAEGKKQLINSLLSVYLVLSSLVFSCQHSWLTSPLPDLFWCPHNVSRLFSGNLYSCTKTYWTCKNSQLAAGIGWFDFDVIKYLVRLLFTNRNCRYYLGESYQYADILADYCPISSLSIQQF